MSPANALLGVLASGKLSLDEREGMHVFQLVYDDAIRHR